MSYSLTDIRLAAYNWKELPNMTIAEKSLWKGLGYAYECYRCGHDKEICDDLAKHYINCFQKGVFDF